MTLNLKNTDYIVILAIVSIAVLTGLINHQLKISENYIELAGPLFLTAGIYFLYRSSRSWQKSIARYLEIIMIGTAFFIISWIYRILSAYFNLMVSPQNVEFYSGFFTAFAVGSVVIVAYGIFMLWQEGEFEFER